jgi:FMN phosphatase YigB (HAD superfamily)
MRLKLSPLGKTWIFDLDGTMVVHNGYLYGRDMLLDGVKELFAQISPADHVLILTARQEEYRDSIEQFLRQEGLRFNHLLCGLPPGERILFNDVKRSGLKTAYAVNLQRDSIMDVSLDIDADL